MEVSGDGFDVPDSTDWLGTPLAGLVAVEQAFRCHVCKDFFNSPMLTSCNHTFCSICIRRCLSLEGKCPLCRASDQESKLRGNWALREAVDAFVQSRDEMLRFARTPTLAAASGSSKRKARDTVDDENVARQSKKSRTSERSKKTEAAEAVAVIARDEIEDTEDSDADNYELPDGLVECPICQQRMKDWQVDKHIDTSCPGSPQPHRGPWASSSAIPPSSYGMNGTLPGLTAFQPPSPTRLKPPDRLPALAYGVLKDAALRKKMTELGLSTAGNRQMLERRHQEWVHIWNANCDSANPKKRSELLHDLNVWERTIGSRAPTSSRAAQVGAQIKDKEFDGAAWGAKHDTSFRDLIANARRSKVRAEGRTPQEE